MTKLCEKINLKTAYHMLAQHDVMLLTQTNTHILVQNKHGMNERLENTPEAILAYIFAD